MILFVRLFGLVFRDRLSLFNSPGCPGSRSVDQAGLELRDLPASASQVCTTMPNLLYDFIRCYLGLESESQIPQADLELPM